MSISNAVTIAEALLPEARVWLRKSVAKLDSEIRQTAAAAVQDLKGAGVVNICAEDPLIKQAVKLYLKAQFGYDNNSEKWEAAYEHLKASLSLSSDYTEPKSEVSCNG